MDLEEFEDDENAVFPTITAHNFVATICNKQITFHILRLTDSIFVWVSDNGRLDCMSVAMTTPYSPSPTTTPLMGLAMDGSSTGLAARLSKKTGKQVFASCSLCGSDDSLILGVTQRLMRELNDFPEKF